MLDSIDEAWPSLPQKLSIISLLPWWEEIKRREEPVAPSPRPSPIKGEGAIPGRSHKHKILDSRLRGNDVN